MLTRVCIFLPTYTVLVRYMLWPSICLFTSWEISKWLNVFLALEATLGLAYIVLDRNLAVSRNTVLLSGTLSQTLNLADFSAFSPWHIDRDKCCQLSSTDDHRYFITLTFTFVYDMLNMMWCIVMVHLWQLRLVLFAISIKYVVLWSITQ